MAVLNVSPLASDSILRNCQCLSSSLSLKYESTSAVILRAILAVVVYMPKAREASVGLQAVHRSFQALLLTTSITIHFVCCPQFTSRAGEKKIVDL